MVSSYDKKIADYKNKLGEATERPNNLNEKTVKRYKR
jgi:hypothetical protein